MYHILDLLQIPKVLVQSDLIILISFRCNHYFEQGVKLDLVSTSFFGFNFKLPSTDLADQIKPRYSGHTLY